MIWENSLQISFFSATLSRTDGFSSTLSIFSSKRMLKRGEWVTVSEEQSVSSSGERRTRRQFATFHCLCKTSPSLATTSVTSTLPAFSKYILAMLPLLSYKYMFCAVVTQRNCSLEKKMIWAEYVNSLFVQFVAHLRRGWWPSLSSKTPTLAF